MNSQIYARDFMLIDQSDMIISFIPALSDGRAVRSSGVERELQHAHEAAKAVYVIWPAKQHPSIFVTQTATKVCAGLDDALDFFKAKGVIMAKVGVKTTKAAARKSKAAKKKTDVEEQAPCEQASPDTPEQQESSSATAAVENGTSIQAKNMTEKNKKDEEESTHAKYERIKKGNLYLTDLQKLTVPELHDIAKKEDIKEYTALKKQDLIFRILKA